MQNIAQPIATEEFLKCEWVITIYSPVWSSGNTGQFILFL